MSKRAEKAALKAYPVRTYRKDQGEPEYSSDYNANDRYRFKEGYELAEKDTIDYACYELEFRLPEYLNYNGVQVERAEFIKDFRKAMEG